MSFPFKRVTHSIRQRLIRLAIWFLANYGREELAKFTTQIVNERATELSIGVFQGMLEREGIAHCFKCTGRFRLKKIGGRYACPAHVPVAQLKEAGVAA